MKNILFISGLPDSGIVKVEQIKKDGNIKWGLTGSADIITYIDNNLLHKTKIIFDTRMDQELPRQMIHGVFNQIADPDTHKITLQKAEMFYRNISKHVPFFNIPSHVMRTTRDNIYSLLQGIDKLHVPKTVKIQPKSPAEIYNIIKKEGFEFPVIFRQAGDHGGVSTIMIDDETEQFYAFALDGRDYYLTQFVDYKENNLYSKYRLIVVNGEVFLRHVMFANEWMVHAKNQLEAMKARKAVSSGFNKEIKPYIQFIITQIYERLELDYFGMDCHIDQDMNILVFEINANMNVFGTMHNSIFKKHAEKTLQALTNMLTV